MIKTGDKVKLINIRECKSCNGDPNKYLTIGNTYKVIRDEHVTWDNISLISVESDDNKIYFSWFVDDFELVTENKQIIDYLQIAKDVCGVK